MNSSFGVSIKKDIRKFWENFVINIEFRIGNGRKTFLWNDNWLGHGRLKELYPDCSVWPLHLKLQLRMHGVNRNGISLLEDCCMTRRLKGWLKF